MTIIAPIIITIAAIGQRGPSKLSTHQLNKTIIAIAMIATTPNLNADSTGPISVDIIDLVQIIYKKVSV